MSIKNEPYLSSMINKSLYSPTNVYNINKNLIVNILDKVLDVATNNSFSIENTLLSRAISSNTKLEQIATIQLSKMFLERVNQNLRKNYIPSIDINYSGVNILKPLSYWKITKSDEVDSVSKLLQVIKGTLNILEPLRSLESFDNDSEKYNRYLLNTLGDGQKETLFNSISKNKFNVYGGTDYANDEKSFHTGTSNDSLLKKYNDELAKSTIVDGYSFDPTNFGDRINPATKAYSFFNTDGTKKIVSKGSAVTISDTSDEFLRVFTKDNQYDSYEKAMKYEHGKLGENSVLQKVVPRIYPKNENDHKNLMFSITNLAQNNNRVMWFAPYNITFSEDSSAIFDEKVFLGRNEPIHTYAGSRRKCTLGFTLIADYPAELNNLKKWKEKSNNEFDKFFRTDNIKGDDSVDNSKDVAIVNKEELPTEKEVVQDYGYNQFDSNNSLKYYFDNNSFEMKNINSLVNDNPFGTGRKGIEKYMKNISQLADFLNSEYGQYYRVVIEAHSSAIANETYNEILSYKRGLNVYRDIVSKMTDKTEQLPEFTGDLESGSAIDQKYLKNKRFTIRAKGEKEADVRIRDLREAMKDRFVALYLVLEPNRINPNPEKFSDDSLKNIEKQDNKSDINTMEEYYFSDKPKNYKSGSVFDYAGVEKSLVKGYGESIQYFSPIFHSQTPIDLNKRVNFLQQCLRQGNTYQKGTENNSSINASDNIGNSIFGKPPVCILRLGDFLNTKILIENIVFDYEPLIWDVNPEGIGMQPMLCNVTMSCILIGGSRLSEPVTELQNALSNNFYANTEYYGG